MNLIDAVKSGRPFRSPGFVEDWYWWVSPEGQLIAGDYPTEDQKVQLSESDILRDDYKLLESRVTITRSQFYAAVADAIKEYGSNPTYCFSTGSSDDSIELLARKLGLK